MRVGSRSVLVLAASLLWLSGCGASEREQVQAKVEQFVHATAAKDYKTLCGQVLAPVLLERFAAVNLPCEQAMQIALSGVHNPTLSIGRIIVTGKQASAITLTSARGQQGSLDAIGLVKTGQGWRVASLGSPVTALAGAKRK